MITFNQDVLAANILIVDDQAINVKLLEKVLGKAGFNHITTTTDSRQTRELFITKKIDLVLLDIRMPYMDGFDVMVELNAIKAEKSYLPIIVLTAELTTETRNKALALGAKDFLTKPFDQLEVLQRINNILDIHLLHKKVLQQNNELEHRIKERTEQLAQSQREIVKRLGLAAEYKDNETGNHVVRMSECSYFIAKQIGFSEQKAEMLLHAAPMHDLGKIGIPDKVLLKPGPLDPDEWQIMKTHVDIGVELLSGSNIDLMNMARTIALTHHERWDGTGYPNQLAGEDIPIEGRICALCDVFDALMSERPYKKAWPIEEVIAYINQQSGKHFDPDLVAVFEQSIEQLLAIRDKNHD